MSQPFVLSPIASNASRTAVKQPPAHRPQGRSLAKPAAPRRQSTGTSSGKGSQKSGLEILVAVKSAVVDANLENVCLIVGASPYAPSGASVVRPGHTSSLVELPASVSGVKTAVYFELALGNQRIPLITDPVFVFAPGAVCVLTITDHTRAHSPSIEVEGTVARLVRAREALTGT